MAHQTKRGSMSILNSLPEWSTYLIAFISMAVLDFMWAIYTKKVTDGKAVGAAVYASILLVINATVIVSFVNNHWMLIPASLGAYVGTYYAVKIDSGK